MEYEFYDAPVNTACPAISSYRFAPCKSHHLRGPSTTCQRGISRTQIYSYLLYRLITVAAGVILFEPIREGT